MWKRWMFREMCTRCTFAAESWVIFWQNCLTIFLKMEHRAVFLLQLSCLLSMGHCIGVTRDSFPFALAIGCRLHWKPAMCSAGFSMVLYGSLDSDVSGTVTRCNRPSLGTFRAFHCTAVVSHTSCWVAIRNCCQLISFSLRSVYTRIDYNFAENWRYSAITTPCLNKQCKIVFVRTS